ncbi:MAG: hypothetical protein RMK57_07420 [Bryobacterales bacterium]|nr:hypothetical protein [Bryobacteraceae bacterium]MDW8354344.1 hypothetical protein [Bryobacterales bacterium]
MTSERLAAVGRSLRSRAWLGVIVAALAPSAWFAWQNRHMPTLGNFSGDDGLYWVTAKSLAEGSGYRLPSFPGEPYQTKYPPLYPFLLSWVWKANPRFPDNLSLAAALAWLMVPIVVGAAGWFYRSLGWSWRVCALLCAVLALHPLVAALGTMLLTELPFTALCLASLCLAARTSSALWPAALAGGLAGLAFLTRTAGIVLLVSVPAGYCLGRRFRAAGAFSVAMAPFVAGWVLWAFSHKPPSADLLTLYYTDYLGYHSAMIAWRELPSVVWRNFGELLSAIGALLWVNPEGDFWLQWGGRLPALAAMAGCWRLARAGPGLQHGFFAAGLSLLLVVWHYPPSERFVAPLLPLVLAGAFVEVRHVSGLAVAALRGSAASQRIVGALVLGGLVGAAVLALYLAAAAHWRYFPAWFEAARVHHQQNLEAYRWIRGHLPERARLFAFNDTAVFLYTGRRASRIIVPTTFYYRTQPQGAREFLARFERLAQPLGIHYILLTPADEYWGPLPARGRTALREVLRKRRIPRLYRSPAGLEVYRLQPLEL